MLRAIIILSDTRWFASRLQVTAVIRGIDRVAFHKVSLQLVRVFAGSDLCVASFLASINGRSLITLVYYLL